jgi:DNA-binding transcriptional MerR regulator
MSMMRMRELEQHSGVGRETIRFYIREGLLPDPERQGRTSARYSTEHLVRLKAIRRLAAERYLPLSVIKALFNAQTPPKEADLAAFPQLRQQLQAFGVPQDVEKTLEEVAERLGLCSDEVQDFIEIGLLEAPKINAQGVALLSTQDILLLEHVVKMRKAGLSPERGFMPSDFRFYLEFVDWLAGEEVRLFYSHMAGHASESEATYAAEQGIASINAMLGLLRRRAILNKLREYQSKDA